MTIYRVEIVAPWAKANDKRLAAVAAAAGHLQARALSA